MTYGSTQGDFRFSGSPVLRFSGSPFLRSSGSAFLRFSIPPSPPSPLPPSPPREKGGRGGGGVWGGEGDIKPENRRNREPEKRRNGETKITLCGTIGHLPLWGRCPKGDSGRTNTPRPGYASTFGYPTRILVKHNVASTHHA